MSNIILELTDVYKAFPVADQEIEVIKGVSFSITENDFVILFGPSGCGKSTILNMLLGLEVPTKGEIQFLNKPLYALSDDERAQIRKQQIGIVYQQSNWIKSLNVIENVYFPLTLRGLPIREREQRASEMLEVVDMADKALQIPTELSSGQQQRISLARAMIADPVLLVADEPTGNLDSKASEEIMGLFKKMNDTGKTVIMVTHDLEYLRFASKSVRINDGVVVGEYKANDPRLKPLSLSKRGNVSDTKNGPNTTVEESQT